MAGESVAAWFAALAASLAAVSSFFNYRLAKEARDLMRADELLIAGVPLHPNLLERDHALAVLQCPLFNKSARKANIHYVSVLGAGGKEIPITWSGQIDHVGNVLNAGRLLPVIDSADLFIRRNDGEHFSSVSIHVRHSHPNSPLIVKFDPTRWMYEE